MCVLADCLCSQEYLAWMDHHDLHLEASEQAALAHLTGMVPGHLNGHDKYKGFLTYFDEQKSGPGQVTRALEAFGKGFGAEVLGHLDNHIAALGAEKVSPADWKTRVFGVFRNVMEGASLAVDPVYMDHRYFYQRDGSCYAVCGPALELLAVLLRANDKNADDFFLSDTFIDRCKVGTNPSVRGFQAEQIVISLVNKGDVWDRIGLKLELEKELKLLQGSQENIVFADAGQVAVKVDGGKIYHYSPSAYNFKFIDHKADLLEKKLKTSKKKPTANLLVFQESFSTVASHKQSLDFFKDDCEMWVEKLKPHYKIQWHFVWVLTKKNKAKAKKSKKKKATKFTEHFLAFTDFDERLDL
jgi:hypothetical protein